MWHMAIACRISPPKSAGFTRRSISGFIGQNVYLFCASEGLATVFRGAVDYDNLNEAMQLNAGQFVTFAQTVGYPQTQAL